MGDDTNESVTPASETPASEPAADAGAHGEITPPASEHAEPAPAGSHGDAAATGHSAPAPAEPPHGAEPVQTEPTPAPALDAPTHEDQTASHTLGSILALPRAKSGESH